MVHGNAVFIREEAKQAKETHGIRFQHETSLLLTHLTSLSIKQTPSRACKKLFAHVISYDVMLGGVTYKSWYLRGAESFAFPN